LILAKEHIAQVLAKYFADKPVKKVWLFGSYARGDADEESDIDVLVRIDEDSKIGLHYLIWHEAIEEIVRKKVQVVSEHAVLKTIRPFIDADKMLVYEK
jgi:uncharacterized protein